MQLKNAQASFLCCSGGTVLSFFVIVLPSGGGLMCLHANTCTLMHEVKSKVKNLYRFVMKVHVPIDSVCFP